MALSVQALISSLIKSGTPAPSRVTSPNAIRQANLPFAQSLAKDLDGLSRTVNGLQQTLASVNPTLSQFSFTDGQTVTVTVRNAAGTGTSTLTFTNGILTAYAP